MAIIRIRRGLSTDLHTKVTDAMVGEVFGTLDTSEIYMAIGNDPETGLTKFTKMSDVVAVDTLPSIAEGVKDKLYINKATKTPHYFDGEDYIKIGVTTFKELTDTPNMYQTDGGKVLAVKTDASGLEFLDLSNLYAPINHKHDDLYAQKIHSHSLGSLTGVDLTTSPTEGQALVFDEATGTWKAKAVAGGTGGGTSYDDTELRNIIAEKLDKTGGEINGNLHLVGQEMFDIYATTTNGQEAGIFIDDSVIEFWKGSGVLRVKNDGVYVVVDGVEVLINGASAAHTHEISDINGLRDLINTKVTIGDVKVEGYVRSEVDHTTDGVKDQEVILNTTEGKVFKATGKLDALLAGGVSGGFTVAASSTYSGSYPASYAVNGTAAAQFNQAWQSAELFGTTGSDIATPVTFTVTFTNPQYLKQFSIQPVQLSGAEYRSPKHFYLEASDDNVTWKKIGEWDKPKATDLTAQVYELDAYFKAKYFRFSIFSNYGTSTVVTIGELRFNGGLTFTEIDVTGKNQVEVNHSLSAAVIVSSTYNETTPATYLNDSSDVGSWAPLPLGSSVNGSWAGYDFGSPKKINKFRILQNTNTSGDVSTVAIEKSSDNVTWTSVGTYTLAAGDNTVAIPETETRYIRLKATGGFPASGWTWAVAELSFFGLVGEQKYANFHHTHEGFTRVSSIAAGANVSAAGANASIIQVLKERTIVGTTDVVPVWTSDTALINGWTLTKSAQYSSAEGAWRAFDGDITTFWSSNQKTNAWIALQLPVDYVKPINGIKVTVPTVDYSLKVWSVEGSNDGTTWTKLHDVTLDTQSTWTSTGDGSSRYHKEVRFTNNTAYKHYRLFAGSIFHATALVSINDIQFFADSKVYENDAELGFYYDQDKAAYVVSNNGTEIKNVKITIL